MKIKHLLLVSFCFSLLKGISNDTDTLKTNTKKNKAFLKKSPFVFIPGGTLYAFNYERPKNESPQIKRKEIAPFIMKKGEVTNKEYLEFLAYYTTNNLEKYHTLLPDTLVWRTASSFNAPYVEYYFRHPAYSDYPLVGISYNQALAYCEWLTERYHQNPERIFKKVIIRLPTEDEWIYAAQGGNEDAIYPWNGSYIHAANGDIMANCSNLGLEGIYRDTLYEKTANGEFKEVYIFRASHFNHAGVAGYFNDVSDITAPVISYHPNAYGLYNMAGNVSEMVAEIGITHGGSWKDPGYYLQNHIRQFYKSEATSSSDRGFRIVIEVVEY